MKTTRQMLAPYGLYLSLLSALTAIGLYIVQKNFGLPIQISLGVTVIGIALFVLFDPQRARNALTGRQARYSSNALVLFFAFFGILVAVNYLVYSHSKRWDLTENQSNTLSPETVQILQSLPKPVLAEAFYTARTDPTNATKMLQNLKDSSQGKFDFRFINPESDPVTAKAAKVTRDATVVLVMGDQQEQVTFPDEPDFSQALVRLINPSKRVIYFLIGQGEYDASGNTNKSIKSLKQELESKNYTVNFLSLLSNPTIPDDALAVVVAGPLKPVSTNEVDLLKKFQGKGKALIVLMEPSPLTEFKGAADPLADFLASDWGVKFNDDVVVDPGVNPPLTAVSNTYGDHPITQKMMGLLTVFPTARSLKVSKVSDAITSANLIQTSNRTWGERDFASIESNNLSADAAKDNMGPLTVAVALTNDSNKSRLVVAGDSEFISDTNFNKYGNSTFFDNSVDWVTENENIMQLTPRTQTMRYVVPPSAFAFGLILLVTIFLIPGGVLFAGILVWAQRRRKG